VGVTVVRDQFVFADLVFGCASAVGAGVEVAADEPILPF
jgi:hypothetical protein